MCAPLLSWIPKSEVPLNFNYFRLDGGRGTSKYRQYLHSRPGGSTHVVCVPFISGEAAVRPSQSFRLRQLGHCDEISLNLSVDIPELGMHILL